MLWTPQKGIVQVQHNLGATASATPGTSVSTFTTAPTKGTAVELITSTSFDVHWVTILASNYGLAATASQGCLDILVGAATERVLIANLLMGYCGSITANGNGPKRWDFPLYIPAGTRIAAQVAGARLSTAMRVGIICRGWPGGPPHRVGTQVTTYGIGTVPNGTTITPGASGAEGAWAQITASTTSDHFAIVPSFQLTGDTTTTLSNQMVDIGLGAATEEQIAESYWFSADGGEYQGGPWNSYPHFQDIPTGTRLVMRASNSAAIDGGYNGALHCVGGT
jgi:hypothetical protein